MKRSVVTVACAIAGLLPAMAGAQSEPKQMSTPVAYTGCLERGKTDPATFVLAHPVQSKMKARTSGAKSAAPAMMDADMSDDHAMHADPMMVLQLASTRVDLAKHVGHKVSVAGTEARAIMDSQATTDATLTVTSLKMLAKSCS